MERETTYQHNIDKDLPLMLVASVCFHVSVICIFALKLMFFPAEPINYEAAVRVDLVALPEKQVSEPTTLKNEEPAQEPLKKDEIKTEVEKSPIPAKEPTKINFKKKQKSAIERLKALQNLEDEIKNNKESEKVKKIIKGNVLASGTSIKGLNKLDYDTYIGDIDSQIKTNWVLPEWLATAHLRTRVLVKIDERGYVIKKDVILSSNNQTYDSLALDAIDRSSPFPAPPEKFVNLVGVDGIVFQFPD